MSSLHPAPRDEDAASAQEYSSEELSGEEEAEEEGNERREQGNESEEEVEGEEEQDSESPSFFELRGNELRILLANVSNDDQVARLVQVLRANADVRDIWFHNLERRPPRVGQVPGVEWGPLLREIETQQRLERVFLGAHEPMPVFDPSIFQALQRNANLFSLDLYGIALSNNDAEGLVSLLDAVSNLEKLVLGHVVASDIVCNNVAAALQRNTIIDFLRLHECSNQLVRPIFQALAAPGSTSRLTKVFYAPHHGPDPPGGTSAASVTAALVQFLQSTGSTIRSFGLDGYHAWYVGFQGVLDSLARNTSMQQVEFYRCRIGQYHENRQAQNVVVRAQILADFVRSKDNLSTLHIKGGDLFEHQQIFDALTDVLVHPKSPLRCFGFAIADNFLPDKLQALLTAVSRSIRLERFYIDEFLCSDNRFQLLLDAFPSFRVEVITLSMTEWAAPIELEEERLLAAVKDNYIVQDLRFNFLVNEDFCLSEAGETRLNTYLERNRKLAEWVADPEQVPRDLWQYAMMLAIKAGANTLFQSLLALSGEDVGLKRRGRKRKRPQYYKP